MRTNVLNNLSNVVEKGTSKVQVGNKLMAGVPCSEVGRISEEGAIEHPLITHSAPFGIRWKPAGEKGSSRVWKHVAMIFAVLVLSVANIGMAWGAYTPTADEVIKLQADAYKSDGTNYSKHAAIAWAGNPSFSDKTAGDPNNGGAATSSNVKTCSVKGNGGAKNLTISITGCSKIIVYHESHASRYVELRSGSKSGTLIGKGSASTYYTEVDLTPETIYTIFLHGTTGSDDQDFYVYAVKLIKGGSSCAAANLTAANITSDGDQIVGTGITFSKVGSPASGDTWYWQTSATGTDDTYNATSPYTTATTAGSYTVYLRAYNTSGECWGTAIGKTNTIISCPLDVYNGENVDKGNTTASGWTINSSTNMTKTSGSSNGYSYWYQAGSASNYVQFDGSIALVSGDQIKIQWTHTNGSNKTLALTINGSSASLTSGGTAKNSVLTEAVYDVTSAINVTSIKLNSSGSSGCIIYQVSIVKAACASSCTAPNHVDVAGRWDRFGGETISLTATAYSSAGTGSPIADGDITGWQWEKLIGSTWTALSNGTAAGVTTSGATTKNLQIANCGAGNSGKYRCVVSTGATCSTPSATATDGSEGFGVKVYVLECYNGGTTEHHFTRTGDSQAGTLTMTLTANTAYTFKVHADNTYYGNSGTIDKDETNWVMCNSDNGASCGNLTVNSGLGGTFTFGIEYSTSGSSSVEGEPEISVTYPRKTIYLVPNSDWTSNSAKFAFYYYGTSGTGWTDFLSSNECGMSADIPQWNGLNVIAVRFNPSDATPGWNGDGHVWNQTGDIAATADKNCVTITDWNAGTYGTYSTPTYTISYATGSTTATGGAAISGSKASESKTCGVDFTLPSSAVFTATGYTQTGWAISDGGSQTHALGGSYTTNAAQTFYPVWEVAAVLTALECNTLYKVEDMVASSITSITGTEQYAAGLSSNTKFEVLGTGTVNATGGPMGAKSDAATISGTAFTNSLYFKGTGNKSGEIPTSRGIKFIVPNAGKLDIYVKGPGGINIVKDGGTGSAIGSGDSNAKVTVDVTAGTYYLYATASSRTLFGIQLNCCTTPAAPTAFSAGSITSTGATFSITDAGDAASYDIYYATSSTAPTASTPATTTSTSKTKAVTGLTASTTYYAWVRSVCDADHKSAWVALGTTSFTTAAAEPEALVHWIVTVDASTWSLNGSPTTTDGTNITSISSSIDAASSPSTGASGTTAKVALAAASDNVDKAASFTFTVNSAKKVEPERVTCQVFNVGGSSGGQLSYKAQLSDNNGHIYYSTNTVVPASEATLTDATFTFASDLVLTGNVTIKVYGWKSGSAGSAFRMGADVKLFGEVQNAADYTVTHTLSNVTKSAGATSVKEGNNYTATYAVAGDYALPSTITVTIGGSPATAGTDYTWTQGTGVVTIPGNKVTGNIVITVTGVAVVNYSITYHCNGAESGCPSDVAATTNLPSPLPTGLTKDGYDFGGWFTDSECTVAAVAGAALTGNTDLYAKWTEHIASECITITNFETSQHNNSSNKPDSQGKYIYGYKTTVDAEHAVTITTSNTNNKGQNSNADMLVQYGTSIYIYADNTTTGGTPATFSNVTSVSLKIKNKHATDKSNFTIKVGSTTIANAVSLTDANNSTYTTYTYNNLAQLSGKIEIHNGGSGSTNFNFFVDDIEICTADMSACTTPVIPSLSNQALCEGNNAAAWVATVTNSAEISAAGETVSYQWQLKNGSNWDDISGATSASYDVSDAVTEAMAGTYRVVVTVSKAGYSSSSATREVTLSVTDATEVTGITADKATVYPGNSVTLTATANTSVTWLWYTCTNAEGAGESEISGATSAAYTIASAPAAGTYHYKAKGTSSCGTASMVYTLTVSEAAGGDCETEFWFAKAADLPEGATAATHITGTPSGSSSASYTATIDGNNYTITGQTGQKTGNVTITVPEDYEGTLYVVVQGSSSRTITLSKGGVQVGQETPANSTWGTFTFSNLDAGTYTLVSSGNIGWGILALKLCSAVACSDPEVTASADNTTACVGTSVTFTAANAHASATYQWQKLNGTWTNISGATESTYNINPVVAGDAGKYRVIASHDCNRTSNEVTLSIPSVPDFGSTVPASVSVMQTIALSINTVEATDAVKYRWYKSADPTWDAGDVEIGTNKELIKAYDGEAIGSPSYYIFCRAQNSCGITTSTAIAVNVTTYVEEDCATRGNEGDAAFSFENSGAGQGSYESTACWTMNSNSKILVYYPPTGKYFKTAKVTIASSSESKASYNWSTNGGTSYTAVSLTVSSTLTERTIDLSAHGNVDAFQIGRNFDSKGSSSGTLYVSKICFEYTDACAATTVTPSIESVDYEMGGAWSNPTFTLSVAGTLSYSSSNEDIASVDDDGTVTFNGEAGTVTITASYAGGTISETEYCASSGSYTINVSCPGGAPKVVADGSTDMSGCNSSVTLHAKTQDGTSDFADGTYQWFRNGEEIDDATSSSYTATQAGTYTVERTNGSGCTTPSTNSAVVTSETTEPEVERLVPFQYYHVDKTYSDQMKMRHLFAVKNSGKLDGKSFKMYVSRSGGAATDVTSSNALVVVPNGDGHVDTVMVDLNKLSGKYSENDELVYTCKAIDCNGNVSEVYKNTITMNVIDETPTLALICSGSSKAEGTRKTGELTVGGDFLTGYNVADLCQQTGNTSFDANTEWGLYTDLKTQYIVTPVNGYAVFNKLNYEPFDILLLTDYPKASKSDAAKDVLDDMAALCDYRPMLSFKTHMVAKSPSKWAAKGFTTSPVVTKADGRLNLNIVCYAHPMFNSLKTGDDVYTDVGNTSAPLVYTMLTGTGYESSKGMQGFELAAAENFVTIGLTHYNATIAKNSPLAGEVEWTPGSEDRMLVTVAERQANPEARFILFSLNCGAQSKLTDKGEEVVLACLNYLLGTAEGTIEPADCSFTFDNGAGNNDDDATYKSKCPECTGTKGDGLWTTAANWGPDYRLLPGEFTSVRIKKPVEVDDTHAHVMEVRIIDEGSIDIPAGKALDVKSTIRRMDGSEIYPTEIGDIHIGSGASGNGTLIFNNDEGDTKARVDMYSKAFITDFELETEAKNYQYIGSPYVLANAAHNYYDSWLYYWTGTKWKVVKNGGPMTPWTGYCITQVAAGTTYWMDGTLTATGTVDIAVGAGQDMVVGNSWTAPLYIKAFTDDDFENLLGNVYFFNTGIEKDHTLEGNMADGDRYAGSTYVTVPIHAASYTGDSLISSLQGFFVTSNGSAGTLHLDYDRHVRPAKNRNILSGPMHAPKRYADSNEPEVVKIKVSGENYDDRLVLLARADFSAGFDNGWDGDKWDGNEASLYIYSKDERGVENSVSAIPEMEGTVVGFRAGEDEAYTFTFEYLNSDEPLYLFDTENNSYTQIVTGGIYRFFTNDKEKHERFVLTRHAPQIATGCENLDGGEGAKAKKLLIEDKMFIMVNGLLYDATGKVVK